MLWLRGKIEKNYSYFLPIQDSNYVPTQSEYEFQENYLTKDWTHRRVPLDNCYDLTSNSGYLTMYCKEPIIQERTAYNFTGVKQKETNF